MQTIMARQMQSFGAGKDKKFYQRAHSRLLQVKLSSSSFIENKDVALNRDN